MIRNIAKSITQQSNLNRLSFMFSSNTNDGATFLKMVDSYFDKASVHTGIRADYLNFYKKPDNVVKCSIPIIRGKFTQ